MKTVARRSGSYTSMEEVMACSVMDSPPVVTRMVASVALLGEEVVATVVGNEDVGVVSEGVVGRRNPERIHGASRAVGAVEGVVDGVGGVGDVLETACAIEPELVAIRAVSVVGHHAELEVHRSTVAA